MAETKEKKEQAKTEEPNTEVKELRGIVRLSGKDLKGEMKLSRALARVKGVGERLAVILAAVAFKELGVPETTLIGELSEEQLTKLEEILSTPSTYGVPTYMLNRRKDADTGADLHLIGTDLTFAQKQDIEREKETNSWKGFRHVYGQKVRGQRTRSTGRKGMSVGVIRKAFMKSAGPAKPGAATEKKEKK